MVRPLRRSGYVIAAPLDRFEALSKSPLSSYVFGFHVTMLYAIKYKRFAYAALEKAFALKNL